MLALNFTFNVFIENTINLLKLLTDRKASLMPAQQKKKKKKKVLVQPILLFMPCRDS